MDGDNILIVEDERALARGSEYSLFFQRANYRSLLPREDMGSTIDDADSSDQVIIVPIGDRNDPIGYVELSNGINFETEALATSRRALLIAGSIAIIFAVIMGKRLSRPITNLIETTRIMSSGDLGVRALIGSGECVREKRTGRRQHIKD